MMLRLALALLVLGYVLPGPRVVEQIAEARDNQPPLHIEAGLAGIGEDWPAKIRIDVHPELGTRVSDGRGGRWLIRRGRVVSGTAQAPRWLPDLEILVIRDQGELVGWLGEAGINLAESELARCGERDCFVLGRRFGEAQLWVDKDRFEVVRVLRYGGRGLETRSYTSWGKSRFPSEISIFDADGNVATLAVEDVRPAADLSDSAFSPRWVEDAPATPAP